jgi:hypothetical protein
MSALILLAVFFALPSHQIGFELNKARVTKCMEVELKKNQVVRGSYLVSGIEEKKVVFTVRDLLDYTRPPLKEIDCTK